MWINHAINRSRQQKSQCVTLLQQPRNESAPSHRNGFHRQRCSHAPLTPHSDAVEQAQKKENPVIRGKPGQNFNQREVQTIDNEWNSAAVAVCKQTEQNGADPASSKARGTRQRNRWDRLPELFRNGSQAERNYEEVERVERRTDKSVQAGVQSITW